jgi:para-aminobenzoate synthetase component I
VSAPLHRHLCVEPIAGGFDPHDLLASFADRTHVALLENPGEPTRFGRYSYICSDPFWVFRSKRARAWSGPPAAEREIDGDPLAHLAALVERFRAGVDLWPGNLPPFCGGAVGYLGYELLYSFESIPDRGRDDLALPDLELFFSGLVFAADRLERTGWICATGFGESAAAAEAEARDRLIRGREQLAGLEPQAARAPTPSAVRPRLREQDLARRGITPCVDRQGYLDAIADIQHNILEGNVFEVCLTQRFDLPFARSGVELYEALRTVNPAPMTAYLRLGELELLSSSPERFLSLDRTGVVETRPIKGTRPRGDTPERDAALRAELEHSEKDRAENLMIVDLARNDLGKVCRFGTVEVTQLCGIEAYEYTWQMVSTVRGVVEDRHDLVGLLRATFPGGSMTGAPKVEAMKIIDRLEPTKRGVFSGSIGYIDFDGAIDWSIVIRTFIKKADLLTFHVGGAIVADSDPEDEYQETLDKAAGLIAAIDFVDLNGERER